MNLLKLIFSRTQRFKVCLFACDAVVGSISFLVAYFAITEVFFPEMRETLVSNLPYVGVFIGVLLLSLHVNDAYGLPQERRSEKEIEIVVKSVLFGFLAIFLVNTLAFKGATYSRYVFVSWWMIATGFVLFERLLIRELIKRLWQKGVFNEKVLVVGLGERFDEIKLLLVVQQHHRYSFVGVLLPKAPNPHPEALSTELTYLGSLEELPHVVRRFNVDKVFLNLEEACTHQDWTDLVSKCREIGVTVALAPDVLNPVYNRISVDDFTGLVNCAPVKSRLNKYAHKRVKNTLDLCGALAGLPVLGLMTLVVGVLIKLGDKGPIFYRRYVLGQKQEDDHYPEFGALKFRTMRVDADEVLNQNPELKAEYEKNFKLDNDPRVTRIGNFLRKTSLDELPQLINVLKGQMSLVGPRMIVRDELEKYGEWGDIKLSVKPGLTGFWQVYGRQEVDYQERIQMDLFYIKNWSIWMDIMILLKTVLKVVKREGAM